MKEPNIRLRALELEDLDFLYQIENDDRLWELGVSNVPYSRRVLLDYITNASADIYIDNQVRLIVENEQNEQVGILDLLIPVIAVPNSELSSKRSFRGRVMRRPQLAVCCNMLGKYFIFSRFMLL